MIQGYIDKAGWQIEGWAACDAHDIPCSVEVYADGQLIKVGTADLPRTDVLEAVGMLNAGFSISLADQSSLIGKTVSVIARCREFNITLGDVDLGNDKKVEIGQQGHLFLVNDSNFCDDYLSGKKYYSEDEAINTAALLRGRELLLQDLGISLIQAVLPEKSEVLSHLRKAPFDIAQDRFVHKVERKTKTLGTTSFHFLRDFIAEKLSIHEAFDKTDNHLSDLAVDLTVAHLLGNSLPSARELNRNYEEEIFRGDLAISLQSPGLTETARLRVSNPAVEFFDDTEDIIAKGGRLTGSCIRFTNNAPLINDSIMIVGTSTARKFLISLADIFKSGLMFWGLNFNYKEILNFRPKIILFVVTERVFSPSIIR